MVRRDLSKKLIWTNLVLSDVDMIHVDQRYGVTILIVIQSDAYFVEQQMNVKMRCLAVQLMVHDNLLRRLAKCSSPIDSHLLSLLLRRGSG